MALRENSRLVSRSAQSRDLDYGRLCLSDPTMPREEDPAVNPRLSHVENRAGAGQNLLAPGKVLRGDRIGRDVRAGRRRP